MDGIELRELRYFIAVAEELNVTRPRLAWHAQPPLSAAIGKLERKLADAARAHQPPGRP